MMQAKAPAHKINPDRDRQSQYIRAGQRHLAGVAPRLCTETQN
jgi:hypothetical protein